MTTIPASFRHIHLELAREKGHPDGDRKEGYDLLVPLDRDGRLDADEWRAHKAACRVRRFRAGETDAIGLLRRRPGGQWYLDYAEGDADDEAGFRFNDERFVPGEYVSLTRGGHTHTYRIVSVAYP